MLKRLVVFLLVFSIFPIHFGFSREPWKSEFDKLRPGEFLEIEVGEVYRVELDDLRPTQFAVGLDEVNSRREKIQSFDKQDLRRYLKKKVGRVVLGPNDTIWLVDGHHLARALTLEDHDEMLVKVVRDCSNLEREDFFERMQRQNLVWLYDHNGEGPLPPSRLPRKITTLKNDPYRSLAWRVEKQGGYREVTTPFQEFIWANFFRSRIPLRALKSDMDLAVSRAVILSRSTEAKELPGYIPGSNSKCLKLLEKAI